MCCVTFHLSIVKLWLNKVVPFFVLADIWSHELLKGWCHSLIFSFRGDILWILKKGIVTVHSFVESRQTLYPNPNIESNSHDFWKRKRFQPIRLLRCSVCRREQQSATDTPKKTPALLSKLLWHTNSWNNVWWQGGEFWGLLTAAWFLNISASY